MIKKFGKVYKVLSEHKNKKGKNKQLGTYSSKEEADKQLAQIEMFKYMKKK